VNADCQDDAMGRKSRAAEASRHASTSAAAARVTAVTAVTADGVVLGGVHLIGPGHPTRPCPMAFVIAHGFTNATASPSTARVIAGFARHAGVVAFDFRGHGRSGGQTSVGRDETADLDAAVRLARTLGYRTVVTVGFSMGGAVAIRHAAIGRDRPDAVVSVSAPSRWYIRHTGPMRRVHWVLESPVGLLASRFVGIRVGEAWAEIPTTPLELAAHVHPIPFLLVHGTNDPYFGPEEAETLHRAAGGAPTELWIEKGMAHAESGTSADLIRRIVAWAEARARERDAEA
jgi:pimeloyl-ACP methyl ester carboxylesterase